MVSLPPEVDARLDAAVREIVALQLAHQVSAGGVQTTEDFIYRCRTKFNVTADQHFPDHIWWEHGSCITRSGDRRVSDFAVRCLNAMGL